MFTDSARDIESRGLAAGREATTTGENVTITQNANLDKVTPLGLRVCVCVCASAYLTCSSAMILSPSSSSSPAAEDVTGGGVAGFGLVSGGTLLGFLGVGGGVSSSPSC